MSERSNALQSIREEDLKIFNRIKQHDENALSELYDRYAQILFSFLMRLLRSVEDAENVLHDTLVELWNTPGKFGDTSGALYNWLILTAHRHALATERSQHLKKQSHQYADHVLPIYSEYVLSHQPTSSVSHDLLKSLITLFQQMSDEEQQILTLGFYDGFTETEIARRLKIPQWTVNWSLRKNLTSISSLIDKDKKKLDDQHKKYIEMCAGYAAGILDDNSKKEYDAHLSSGCDICKEELSEFESAIALLPFAIPAVTISQELKERVLFSIRLTEVVKGTSETPIKTADAISKEPQEVVVEGRKSKKPWFLFSAGMLIGILFLIGGIYTYRLHQTIERMNEGEKEHQTRIHKLRSENERSNSILDVLKSSDIEIVLLKNLRGNEKSFGKLLWDPLTRIAVLHISDLPATDPDMNYQLWLIKEKQYISIGIVPNVIDSTNDIFIRIQIPRDIARKDIETFEVTIEPKGGSIEPAGAVFLRGRVIH